MASLTPGGSDKGNRTDHPVGTGRFYVLAAFLAVCFIGGGGSRDDILSLLYVRPAAILCLAIILMLPGRVDWRLIRTPLWLLAGITLLIVVQLIPLPPSIWMSLPGRELFVRGAELLAMDQPWRPISLTPDLTLNGLAAMVVPFAVLIGFAALAPRQREWLLLVFLVGAGCSALLAILQISSGENSAFYTYRVTNHGAAVGFFANRNHQAVFLALALPMLAIAADRVGGDRQGRIVKRASAAAMAVALIVLIMVTGSRAGMVIGVVAAIWSIFHYLQLRQARHGRTGGHHKSLLVALGATITIGAGLAYMTFSRAEAIQRLLGEDFQGEQRLRQLPYVAGMARDYFPFGSGFGSFDAAYRIHEPAALLSPSYLNHAHNDLLELVITGGLTGALLLVVFLLWWLRNSWVALRSGRPYEILGSIIILFLLAASLVDYPLRTPIMAAFLAVACGWLARSRGERGA